MEDCPYLHATNLPTTLLSLLSNTLVLYQTSPYLPISSLLAVGASSKHFRSLIYDTPGVFRHLDLTQTKSAQFQIAAIDHGGEVWRNVQLDENVTEDDFYGGPLLGIFNQLRRQHILKNIQTLVLDGLSVTADLVTEIVCQDSFNVRILSIREVQNLNERKFQQVLLHAVRPSRPSGTPKLEAIYIFGPKDAGSAPRHRGHFNKYPPGIAPIDTLPSYGGVVYSRGAQIGAEWNARSGDALADEMQRSGDKWYRKSGKVLAKPLSQEWATTLSACQGIISFDAVVCRGPRHSLPVSAESIKESTSWYRYPDAYISPRVATHTLKGCESCGTVPEGFAHFGLSSLDQFPLLAPPPLHRSTAKAAKAPAREDTEDRKLLVRCLECLQGRFCESCHKFWCEDCYRVLPSGQISSALQLLEASSGTLGRSAENVKAVMACGAEHSHRGNPGVKRACFECGLTCANCIQRTQLMCKVCGGGYCTIHNEGSTLTTAGRHAINGCRC